MKLTSKLMIALTLTLILGLVGINVWAASGRQGTVENPPTTDLISPIIPVTGTSEITLLGSCDAKGETVRIKYPNELEDNFGVAPTGFEYLTDGIKIILDGPCDIQVCYPYPKEYEDKNGQIFKWDLKEDGTLSWILLESTISEDPKMICAVEKVVEGGIYDLIGD